MGNCTSRLADGTPQRDSSQGQRSGAKRRKKSKKVKSKCIDEDEERIKAAGCFQFKRLRKFFRKRRGTVMEDLPTPGSLDADDGPASTAASNMLQVTSPDADCNAVELVDAAQLSYRKAGTVDSAPTPGVDAMSYGDRLLHDIAIGLDKVDAEDSDEEFAVLEGLCELVEEDPNLTQLASRHVQVEEDTVACTAIATGDDSKDRLRDGIADEKQEAEVQEYDQVWDNVDTKGMVQHNDQHPTRLSTIPEEEEGDEWEDSIDMQTTDVLQRQTRCEQVQATHPTEFVPLYNVVNRAYANVTPRSLEELGELVEVDPNLTQLASPQVQVEEDTVETTALATEDGSTDRLRDGIDDQNYDAEETEYQSEDQKDGEVTTKSVEPSEGKSIDEFTTENELETGPVEEITFMQQTDQRPVGLDSIPEEQVQELNDSYDMQRRDGLQKQARHQQAQVAHPTEYTPLYNVVDRAYANGFSRYSGRNMPLYETRCFSSPRSPQVPVSTWDMPNYYAGRYSYGPQRLDGYETMEATGISDHSQSSNADTGRVGMGNVGMLSRETTPRNLNTGRQCGDTKRACRENSPQQAGYQTVSHQHTVMPMGSHRNKAAADEHPRMLTTHQAYQDGVAEPRMFEHKPQQKFQDAIYGKHVMYTTHDQDAVSQQWNMATPHETSMYVNTPGQRYQDAVNERWNTPQETGMYGKTPGQMYQGDLNERSNMYTPRGPNMYGIQRQQYLDAVDHRTRLYTPYQRYQAAGQDRPGIYAAQDRLQHAEHSQCSPPESPGTGGQRVYQHIHGSPYLNYYDRHNQ